MSETVERKEACGPPLFKAGPVVIEPPDGDTVPPEPWPVPSACHTQHKYSSIFICVSYTLSMSMLA